ncbi:MAG: type II toxin-antitoxin system VapB family antitoxin [Undibacterium sp.]|nr:type II toxin-antitoxin system VapB family antitoxin [Opitutaceae bacterium]
MKTTIDLDEAKLERVMKLTGLSTRKEAIDYALTQVERTSRVKTLQSRPFFDGIAKGDVVDPA